MPMVPSAHCGNDAAGGYRTLQYFQRCCPLLQHGYGNLRGAPVPFSAYGRSFQLVKDRGFKVGVVTNAFWATTDADALKWLQPLAGIVEDLSISYDTYHGGKDGFEQTHMARQAAERLGIPVDFISVSEPEAAEAQCVSGRVTVRAASSGTGSLAF